jgi:4-cresol dehydrogenase (hydroxylating) flavoprotein subunit
MSSLQPSQIQHAVEAWVVALGADKVAHDTATLDEYARTTLAKAPRPSCILFPESTEEVQAITSIAQQHKVPVYPISGGKNWGYGDACPSSDQAAVIDLGRMNTIIEVNKELAYCVIQPGVTQQQLYDYLQENKLGLWVDAFAAGPDASMVGNTADRGFGHTRYGDHVRSCCGMEVVLADGRVLNTGFGHYGNAKAQHVYPYGVGPYLDGMFTQSNYGIITRIGLWLLPEPEHFSFFYFQLPNFEDLGDVVERLRPLRLDGTLQTAIHIGNDLRVMASIGHYPWDRTQETPIPADIRQQLRKETSAQSWQGSGSLTGTKAQVRASQKALKKVLRGLCTPKFVNDQKLNFMEMAAGQLMKFGASEMLGKRLAILRQNYDLLKGIPTAEPLRGAQWRVRSKPENLDDLRGDGVGLYWVAPTMPMLGADALNIQRVIEPIFNEYGFDMIVSFILLTERSLVAIFNIAFDRGIPEEREAASQCYEKAIDTLAENGYYSYRAGLQGMDKIRKNGGTFWDVATDIKRALDPNDLISPGRYIAPLDKE